MLRDGTGKIQAFLKKDNMNEDVFNLIQNSTRESTIQVKGVVAQKRPLFYTKKRFFNADKHLFYIHKRLL